MKESQFEIGDYVIDREQEKEQEQDQKREQDMDLAVVVQTPDIPADNWTIEDDMTVADYNENYPSKAPVVVVTFEPTLNRINNWKSMDESELQKSVQKHNLQTYTYPDPRLKPKGKALNNEHEKQRKQEGQQEHEKHEIKTQDLQKRKEDIDSLSAFFDGACEPTNPGGHGTYGVVIKHDGKPIYEVHGYLGKNPDMTNNVAEYSALITALEFINRKTLDIPSSIYGDSQLVIRQMNGQYAVRSERIRPYWKKAKNLTEGLTVSFEWIPREKNEHADRLSKEAYYKYTTDKIEKRKSRAQSEEIPIEKADTNKFHVKEEKYTVDLNRRTCTCPDFQNRNIPCKHIYRAEQIK